MTGMALQQFFNKVIANVVNVILRMYACQRTSFIYLILSSIIIVFYTVFQCIRIKFRVAVINMKVERYLSWILIFFD